MCDTFREWCRRPYHDHVEELAVKLRRFIQESILLHGVSSLGVHAAILDL